MTKGMWWAAGTVAAVVAAVHLATAGGYDLFRNELYFIVCGWHPAFGYVDQPPVVPILSALLWSSGQVWLVRLPAVLTAIALVPLTVIFAKELGASTRGAWLAAVASATAPLLIAMTATFSTSTFETIDFTAVAYLITRAHLRNEPRAYWWAGAVAGLAFETKFSIIMWAIGLLVGVLAFGPRSILRSRDLWIGAAIATVIALPAALWQVTNGLPFLELVRNDNSGNFTGGPLGFTISQLFLVNVVLAPLWITGIIAPFVSKRLAEFRFLSVTFVVMGAIIVITHGKQYYFAGAYPTMFALGAAACTQRWRWLIGLWSVLAVANAAVALPFVLPVLPPDRLKFMIDHGSFKPRPMERAGIGAPLMQVLSDEFGWRDLAHAVEDVYAALPEADRSKAVIYADNYGDASAILVYGAHLPPVISGSNNYYLWGTYGYDGSVVLAVNVDPQEWSRLCASATIVGYTGDSPYAMPYEVRQPIVLCRGMHPPLPQQWPTFKHYGVENLGVRNGRR
jgi:4-amino-4-deoxy-L-arabinose transferase-like glycosyltransferase